MKHENAIEILKNGERVCVAGVPEEGILTAEISMKNIVGKFGHKDNSVTLALGASFPTDYKWWIEPASNPLKEGDEITIRIIKAEETDPPKRGERYFEDVYKKLEEIERPWWKFWRTKEN